MRGETTMPTNVLYFIVNETFYVQTKLINFTIVCVANFCLINEIQMELNAFSTACAHTTKLRVFPFQSVPLSATNCTANILDAWVALLAA